MQRQTGFTLIEGLITVLVIGFGFLAIARLQISIWQNHLDGMQQNEAVRLGFENLNAQRHTASLPKTALTSGQDATDAALTQYSLNWNNSPLPASGQLNQVTVTWSLPAQQRSLVLKTVTGQNNRKVNGQWISRFD